MFSVPAASGGGLTVYLVPYSMGALEVRGDFGGKTPFAAILISGYTSNNTAGVMSDWKYGTGFVDSANIQGAMSHAGRNFTASNDFGRTRGSNLYGVYQTGRRTSDGVAYRGLVTLVPDGMNIQTIYQSSVNGVSYALFFVEDGGESSLIEHHFTAVDGVTTDHDFGFDPSFIINHYFESANLVFNEAETLFVQGSMGISAKINDVWEQGIKGMYYFYSSRGRCYAGNTNQGNESWDRPIMMGQSLSSGGYPPGEFIKESIPNGVRSEHMNIASNSWGMMLGMKTSARMSHQVVATAGQNEIVIPVGFRVKAAICFPSAVDFYHSSHYSTDGSLNSFNGIAGVGAWSEEGGSQFFGFSAGSASGNPNSAQIARPIFSYTARMGIYESLGYDITNTDNNQVTLTKTEGVSTMNREQIMLFFG